MNKILSIFIILALAQAKSSDLHFLIMGDWGGQTSAPYYNSAETLAANAMATFAQQDGSEFVLAVGDNFYSYGIDTDEYDPRFQYTFENIFDKDRMNFPFYMCAGNHDHRGNVTAQIEYSKHSSRWTFPDFYYTFEYDVGSKKVQFIMTDSVVLSGNLDEEEEDKGIFGQPMGPENLQAAEDQMDWIKHELKYSTADYIFVAGHYPVYSGCSHGNTKILVNDLKPMLEKYGAHYLAGHDHCEQYINEGTGVKYIDTGSAHGGWYEATKESKLPKNSLQFMVNKKNRGNYESGFVNMHISEENFYAEFLDQDLNVHFTTEKTLPRDLSKYLNQDFLR